MNKAMEKNIDNPCVDEIKIDTNKKMFVVIKDLPTDSTMFEGVIFINGQLPTERILEIVKNHLES